MTAARGLHRLALASLALALVLLGPGVSPGEIGGIEEPLLPFSTYLGGHSRDPDYATAFGPDGVLWVAAAVSPRDFPDASKLMTSPYLGSPYDEDVLVVRIDPSTHAVLSAVRFGGGGRKSVAGLALDSAGNAYVAGTGRPWYFPVSFGGSGGPSYSNGFLFFVARLRPDGSGLAWVNEFGSPGANGRVAGMCLTADGDPVVVGTAHTADFPLVGPLSSAYGGGFSDAFVARLRADGTGPVFSTYLGGPGRDEAISVCRAPDGGIVVTGESDSDEIAGSAEQIVGAPWDPSSRQGFLAEIDPSGVGVRRLGRLRAGRVRAAATAGSLVLTGSSSVDDELPIAPPSVYEPYDRYGFVLWLDPSTWAPLGGVYLDRWDDVNLHAIAVGPDGVAWVAGKSLGRPTLTLPGAVRPLAGDGSGDAYVAAVDFTSRSQVFGTYLGGNDWDSVGAVAVAPDGSAWVAGNTNSTNFPTAHAIQSRVGAIPDATELEYNAFVAQLRAGDPAGRPAAVVAPTAAVVDGHSVRVAWEAGDDTATAFAIDRIEEPDDGSFLGWTRVALVPSDTVEWVDTDVWPDRTYRYSIQAVNPTGGSAPSEPLDGAVPATLVVSITRGAAGPVLKWRPAGFPFWFETVRLQGHLGAADGGALDLTRDGLRVIAGDIDDGDELLSIPPGDAAWHVGRGGALQWRRRGTRNRVDFDPATGHFSIRVITRSSGDVARFVGSQASEQRRIRVVVGNDAGSSGRLWRASGRWSIRTP